MKTFEMGKPLTTQEWNQIRKEVDYPNIREVKKNILLGESWIANSISSFKIKAKREPRSDFEIAMESFLTWKVKLTRLAHLTWCDGVEFSNFEKLSERLYNIKGFVWLGPESNVNKEYKCRMEGLIKLNSSLDKLYAYRFGVVYQKYPYFICKRDVSFSNLVLKIKGNKSHSNLELLKQ